jgi:hypothetical protein
MADREFRQVQKALDEVVSKLKTVTEPKLRAELLQQMRRLLAEAERVASQS